MKLTVLNGSNLLTNSRMQCFKRCPRDHFYRYELGVRVKGESKALRMGSAFHVGLDHFKKGATSNDAILAACQPYEEAPKKTDLLIDDWMVERETVATLLSGYFWRWSAEGLDPSISVAEVIASEFAFELPIRNPETMRDTPTFRVAGKIDGIVRLGDGRLAVIEHKTTSDSIDAASDYWRRLRIDQQISLYMLAARSKGYAVETVLYDVIRKPGIAPTKVPLLDSDGQKIVLDVNGVRVLGKNGKPRQSGDAEQGYTLQTRRETPDEFAERLRLDIAERPDFYYARQEIPRLVADLDDFQRELWQQQQTIREAQKGNRWYRNTGACTLMGRCAYLDFCHQGFDPDAPLPAGFEVVENIHPELVEGD